MIEYNLKLNEDEIRYVLDALESFRFGETKQREARLREFNTIEKLTDNIREQVCDNSTKKIIKIKI